MFHLVADAVSVVEILQFLIIWIILIYVLQVTSAQNCCFLLLNKYRWFKGSVLILYSVILWTVIRLRAGRPRNLRSIPGKADIFLIPTSPRLALRPTQPPIQRVLRFLLPGVKRPGHEVEHSPLCSAEIKNTWSYTFTPTHVFLSCGA
jgi:hypothetical protein